MKIENFFDFCSGIGGGRLGLENAELKSVGYSDTSRLSVLTYDCKRYNCTWKQY